MILEILKQILFLILAALPLLGVYYLGVKFRRYLAQKRGTGIPSDAPTPAKFSRKTLIFLITSVILIIVILAVLGFIFKPETQGNPISFKKIDAHSGFLAGADIRYYLVAMLAADIRKAVLVPEAYPASDPRSKLNALNLSAALMNKNRYPDKLMVFASAWSKDPNAAKIIEKAVEDGARGIALSDWINLKKNPENSGPLDSPGMYDIYRIAQKNKIPVMLYADFSDNNELRGQFEKIASEFKDVNFILGHYCQGSYAKKPSLNLCSQILDKHPNVYTNISMDGGLNDHAQYFNNNRRAYRKFIIKHQNRILWGTGMLIDGKTHDPKLPENAAYLFKRVLTDFAMLGYPSYRSFLNTGNERIYAGLDIPDRILKKIFWKNPQKIFGF